MKSIRLPFLLTLSVAFAETFISSNICKTCHPAIYNEYMNSMHRKSSVANDPVHEAVWGKHPLKAKKRYSCAVCHTPSDTKLIKALQHNDVALPDESSPVQRNEPIGCAICHRIRDIQIHKKHNRNIYNTKTKHYYAAKSGKSLNEEVTFHETESLFGLSKTTEGSPFHTIDYANPRFADGSVCLGCHDHKRNKHGLAICDIDRNATENDRNNCITCHMPQVKGSLSTLTPTQTHAFHGFAGPHVRPRLLAKHIDIKADTDKGALRIRLVNKADHRLFTHPLRRGELRVEIERNGRRITLPPVAFYTVLGRNGQPAAPWIADRILERRGIGAKEKRTFRFDVSPRKGDTITVALGIYIVSPDTAKALEIDTKEVQTFRILKSATFRF